jgi:hypothetical protein
MKFEKLALVAPEPAALPKNIELVTPLAFKPASANPVENSDVVLTTDIGLKPLPPVVNPVTLNVPPVLFLNIAVPLE